MDNIYNISSSKSFLDVIALSLLEDIEKNPEKLQEYLILLPTRRACNSLKDAFLKYSNQKALILPKIQPIGDAFDYDDLFWFNDEDEENEINPPISSTKRLMILSNLVMQKSIAQGINLSPHTAFILSKDLASLFDEVLIENLSWENLTKIIPENLNTYWQEVLTFLEIVSKVYPDYLKEQNLSDSREYNLYKIKKLSQIWKKNPPNYKVIAAGNTATQPIISELLQTIANLKNGTVILPGLDKTSSDSDFENFNEGHYQYGLKRFLNSMNINRSMVKEWGENIKTNTINNDKERLIIEALKPVELTQNWRFIEDFSDDILDNVYKIECKDDREEALIIALIMRKTLETEGKTAALVTTDVNLGKKVSLELERFGININNSAGLSLSQTPVGVYFNVLLNLCIMPSPVSLLAVLKHPLTSAGFGDECRNIARQFEKELRGKTKVYSIENIENSLKSEELKEKFKNIVSILNPLLELQDREIELSELIKKHIEVAEKMAISAEKLWQGSAGLSNSVLLSEILQEAHEFFKIKLSDYSKLFLQFQNQVLVRNPYNTHKRLEILGPMESRLQHKDIMILGGLNEGMFPKTEEAGPWMSYQMRGDFGLPSNKQKLGISASDFSNCFMAGEVYLTRSLKSGGTPNISSRWLQRLDAVINIAAKSAKESMWDKTNWSNLAEILDKPEKNIQIEPVAAEQKGIELPNSLSVSAIEKLMKDPYSFYARYILDLKPLKDLEPKINAADYGSAVHFVFEWFVNEYKIVPANGLEIIQDKAREIFKERGISFFWLSRFNRASEWFIKELRERDNKTVSYTESKGEITIKGVQITARADRIDKIGDSAKIIDYKTGKPPSEKEILSGISPQLAIEALIVNSGGFEKIPALLPEMLVYYQIKGQDEGIIPKEIKPKIEKKEITIEELMERTEKGIERLINTFYKQKKPFEARPDFSIDIKYSDYEHLERIKEWSSLQGEDE